MPSCDADVDRAYGEWAEACRDAWEHVLALTDRVALR